jgi:hypothetical protein
MIEQSCCLPWSGVRCSILYHTFLLALHYSQMHQDCVTCIAKETLNSINLWALSAKRLRTLQYFSACWMWSVIGDIPNALSDPTSCIDAFTL